MPIDPSAVQWDAIDPKAVQWDAPAPPPSKIDRFGKGLRDPIDGGAQLLTKILPAGLVDAGNRANNWLADKTGLVGRLPEGGVDQQVKEAETAYQAARAAAEPHTLSSLVTGQRPAPGFDWMRLAGNALNPVNLSVAGTLPAAATMVGRVGVGAAGGAASSLLNPVTKEGDYWSEKGKQAVVGGLSGGAVPFATGTVARLVSPKASVNPNLQNLRAEGVRPTVGQTLGGIANTVEEKAMSVPIVGDMIASARRGASEDLNRAAFQRALAPVGETLPKGMIGREAVGYVGDRLGAKYDALLPKMTTQADAQFAAEVGNLQKMVSTGSIDPNAAKAFSRVLQNDVLGKFKGQSAITGETLKAIEGDLGQQIKRYGASTDADQRLVGDALKEVQDSLRSLLQRTNPQHADELKAINAGYANFKRVQKAAAGLGSDEGVFTPAQLQNAIKAGDRSKDKARFAEGNALMQDLSEAGKSVLGNRVPDSGTVGRALVAGGASFLDPTGIAPVALGIGSAAYTRPVQNALTALIAKRPDLAQPIANALRKSSPGLVPLAAQMGLNALNR